MTVDHEKALGFLDEWDARYATYVDRKEKDSADYRWLVGRKRTLLRINQALGGAPPTVRGRASGELSGLGRVATFIRGQLEYAEQDAAIFEPIGPKLAAAELHPWVWDAARFLWHDNHRREAIQTAATAVETQLKLKVGDSERSGVDLVNHAFSSKRDTGVLRYPGLEPGTRDWENYHEGARDLAKGAMARIRNPVTHELTDLGEQEALEQLACLSFVARLIESAELAVDE